MPDYPPHPTGLGFGTAWYPDHWPESDWARDLDHIAATGITAVRFGEFSWSWFEPAEGQYDFAAYDRFVDLADQRGLKLVLCTPTATPPPWVMRRFPDAYILDPTGQPYTGPRHFACYNHPGLRQLTERTVRTLVAHFADHPAVIAWQVDNEPNHSERLLLHDFNPHTLADFRRWLQAKYHHSLDALNAAWYTNFWSQRYGNWDHIPTGRIDTTNPQAWLDFARYREQNIADFIHWQAGLIRELAPNHAVGTNIPDAGLKISAHIAQDYYAQARGLDWVGTDLYMATGHRDADQREMRYRTDLMRSVADAAKPGGATFILAETQAGPHQRTWRNSFAGEAWGPDYLRDAVGIYAEHGARHIWYFLWRPTPAGTEMGMNGMTGPDGGPSPRTKLARKLADTREKLLARKALRDQRPLALVHYSRDTIRFVTSRRDTLDDLETSYLGWHRLLDEAGYRITFISDDQLAAGPDHLPEPDTATRLILPQSHLLDDPQQQTVLAFAAGRGRRVLLGPHTAMLDARGHLRQADPGGRLAAAMGLTPGYWHDIATSARLPKIKLGPITARRAIDRHRRGTVTLAFREPADTPAILRRRGLTWLAFDAGPAYDHPAATAPGRRALRRHLLGDHAR